MGIIALPGTDGAANFTGSGLTSLSMATRRTESGERGAQSFLWPGLLVLGYLSLLSLPVNGLTVCHSSTILPMPVAAVPFFTGGRSQYHACGAGV